MPKISVLLATHNNEKTITKAIQSAQKQTVSDIEIVVVDDASTDGTYGVVMDLADHDASIKLVHLQQNVGPGGARNVALTNATGEWITILDGDDWYDSNRLEVLLNATHDYDADLVADNLKIYDHVRDHAFSRTNYGNANQVTPLTPKHFFDRDNPLLNYPIGYIQPLIRRKFLTDHQIVYDGSYRVGEDFIFVSDILLQGARAFIVPGAYYNYMHIMSPMTQKVVPDSHSSLPSGLSLFIRGCNEILQRHGPTMSSEARQALLRRRWVIEGSVMHKEMREALRELHVFKASRMVAHPLVLATIGQNLIRRQLRWLRKARNYWPALRG